MSPSSPSVSPTRSPTREVTIAFDLGFTLAGITAAHVDADPNIAAAIKEAVAATMKGIDASHVEIARYCDGACAPTAAPTASGRRRSLAALAQRRVGAMDQLEIITRVKAPMAAIINANAGLDGDAAEDAVIAFASDQLRIAATRPANNAVSLTARLQDKAVVANIPVLAGASVDLSIPVTVAAPNSISPTPSPSANPTPVPTVPEEESSSSAGVVIVVVLLLLAAAGGAAYKYDAAARLRTYLKGRGGGGATKVYSASTPTPTAVQEDETQQPQQPQQPAALAQQQQQLLQQEAYAMPTPAEAPASLSQVPPASAAAEVTTEAGVAEAPQQTVSEFLVKAGLAQFAGAIAEYGVETLEDLANEDILSDTELLGDDVGMKKFHVKKLRLALAAAERAPQVTATPVYVQFSPGLNAADADEAKAAVTAASTGKGEETAFINPG